MQLQSVSCSYRRCLTVECCILQSNTVPRSYRMCLQIHIGPSHTACRDISWLQIVLANTGWPADGLLEIAASVQGGLNTLADGPEIANECTSEGLKSSLHVLCTARAFRPYRCYALVSKRTKIDQSAQKIESRNGPESRHATKLLQGSCYLPVRASVTNMLPAGKGECN
jgi:hypothetical protein